MTKNQYCATLFGIFLLISGCSGGGANSGASSGGSSGGGSTPGENTAPTAVNDSFTVLENSSNNTFNVLGNDTDAESSPRIESFDAQTARSGTVQLNDAGTPSNPLDDVLSYTPPTDFNSEPGNPTDARSLDSFSYTITDGQDSATATVEIDILPVACLSRDAQLSAGKGYCFRTYFCSTADPEATNSGSNAPCANDTTKIWLTVHLPHPGKLNAAKPAAETTGYMPLIIHGHGFGGSKSEDFSFPQHFVAEQASGLAWENGYFAISFTQRGFGEGDGSERSGGRIGIMDPLKEGIDMNQLVDWTVRNLRGNSDGSPIDLSGQTGAADSIYNKIDQAILDGANPADSIATLLETNTTPIAGDNRPSLLMNDNQTRLVGGEDAPCALPANAQPGPTEIPPECDPAIGSTGYSYGGGFQYALARSPGSQGRWGGERLDAMVPHGTWFDLRYSLGHNVVPKTVWINLLTVFAGPPPQGGGNGEQLPDALVQGRAEADATNKITAPLINDPFRKNFQVDYCDTVDGLKSVDTKGTAVHSTADVFHIQGYRDTLFNFNEGYDNVRCYDRSKNFNGRASRDARLLVGVGGHPIPELTAVNYTGRSTSMDIDEVVHCGDDGTGKPKRIVLKQAMMDWFDEKLRGMTGKADGIPKVCIVQRNTDPTDELVDDNFTNDNGPGANPLQRFRYPKEGVVYDSLDEVLVGATDAVGGGSWDWACDGETVGDAGAKSCDFNTTVNFGASPTNPEFIPLYTVPVGATDTARLAGMPLLAMTIASTHPDPLFFVGLGIRDAATGTAELIHDQLTPIRPVSVGLPGTDRTFPWQDTVESTVAGEGSGALENDDSTFVGYGCEPNSVQRDGMCVKGRMVGIGERLVAGDEVGLMVWGGHEQYSSNNSRTPGTATISGTVDLPLVAPTPLPVSVNP